MSGARLKSQWKINALLLWADAFSASSCPEPCIIHLHHILILKSFLCWRWQRRKKKNHSNKNQSVALQSPVSFIRPICICKWVVLRNCYNWATNGIYLDWIRYSRLLWDKVKSGIWYQYCALYWNWIFAEQRFLCCNTR